jgi:hypothetical protein
MDVYWPAFIFLMYILCGLGFTIMGVYALAGWVQRKRRAHSDQADRPV